MNQFHADARAPRPGRPTGRARLALWLWAPQPFVRLAALRLLVPLAILGFLSSRLVHADHWIGSAGFHVPDLGHSDYRQPIYIGPLPNWAAWSLAWLTVASGLALAAGALTRVSAPLFAVALVYLALADRLAAFTVSKLGAVLAIALAFTPCGAAISIDAWRRRSRLVQRDALPLVSGGNVRFFQILLAVTYCATGIGKVNGDWLVRGDVIYTNLHDSYQTAVSYFLASTVPGWAWTGFQVLVLVLELGAPLWFAFRRTRYPAVLLLLGMHAIIGLGFGPVIWFALLMAALLVSCYGPSAWLEEALRVTTVRRGASDSKYGTAPRV